MEVCFSEQVREVERLEYIQQDNGNDDEDEATAYATSLSPSPFPSLTSISPDS